MQEVNKLTHEIKLNLFNDYDMYKLIVKSLHKKTKLEQIDIIKAYSKRVIDYLSSQKSILFKENYLISIDYEYLSSCFVSDLKP